MIERERAKQRKLQLTWCSELDNLVHDRDSRYSGEYLEEGLLASWLKSAEGRDVPASLWQRVEAARDIAYEEEHVRAKVRLQFRVWCFPPFLFC
jgi:hypothetical protein